MRVILDTNIFISALLVQGEIPDAIYQAWTEKRFTLLTCQIQMDEVRETLRKPTIAARIRPHDAGRLVNDLKRYTVNVDPLPHVELSPDPTDDFLLAASEAGEADFLVTGDKSGLLSIGKYKHTKIVTARQFARQLG